MATLVLKEGQTLGLADVVHFCQANMAYFMVPRFVEFRRAIAEDDDGEGGKIQAARGGREPAIRDLGPREGWHQDQPMKAYPL